ncbi:MAG: hypothetical protein HY704_08980 [Gemmatimonadetes bacterium]|nr:hypothetical protein [Gemmatimonadota bacterium]
MTFDAWFVPAGFLPPCPTRELDGPRRGIRTRTPVLEPAALRSLARSLRRARSEALLDRSVSDTAAALGRIARRFLNPDDPLRRSALELTARLNGYSAVMSEVVLDGMARDWLEEPLMRLVSAEFGDPGVLDGFRPGPEGARVRAIGPELSFHVGAGNVPGVAVTSMVRALLVKSAALVKPGAGDAALPVLFARALAERDEGLAACVAVVYWPGGEAELERAALEEADLTVIYGGEDAVAALRQKASADALVLPYHHRISFGIVGRDAVARELAGETAIAAARAAAIFEQRGCVSPHLLYVERGGEESPARFAERLARAFARLEQELPPGALEPAEAIAIQQVRGTTELQAAAHPGVMLHRKDTAGWTVIYDENPEFEPSCLNRVIRVKPVSDLYAVVALVRPHRRYLQTVGVAGAGGRLAGLAEELGRIGVTRITSLPRMPFPPPWWHQDGMSPLRSLVRWVDLE